MNETQRLLVQEHIKTLRPVAQAMSDHFYRALFARAPELEQLFSQDANARLAKFNSMLSTFANLKHLDKIGAAIQALGKRHASYGVKPEFYVIGQAAFMQALREGLGDSLDEATDSAWQEAFHALIRLMADESQPHSETSYQDADQRLRAGESVIDSNLLEDIGGIGVIETIHRRFYDEIFADAWLGKFFLGKNEAALVRKQTDFMVACFGGQNVYQGDTPAIAHMHMLITDEMLELREDILRRAIAAEGLSENIIERWLSIDRAFHAAIAKHSKEECVMRCMGQQPIVAPKPANYPWPKDSSGQ